MGHVPRLVPRSVFADYMSALRAGDSRRAIRAVLSLNDLGFSVDEVIADLIAPAQEDIGTGWQTAAVSIAEEHQATAIAESALAALLSAQVPESVQTVGKVVLCGAENEWHSIATRMVAVTWSHLGWDVRLIIPSAPAQDVAELLGGSDAFLAGVSCAMSANLFGAWRMISALRAQGCWVVVGGRGFAGPTSSIERALGADSHCADAQIADERLREFLAHGSPGKRPAATPSGDAAEASALSASSTRFVADCVDLGDALRPGLLASDLSKAQARDDIALLVRALVSTVLLDQQSILADHLAWYRLLLGSSGNDPDVAELWVDVMRRRCPSVFPAASAHLAAIPT